MNDLNPHNPIAIQAVDSNGNEAFGSLSMATHTMTIHMDDMDWNLVCRHRDQNYENLLTQVSDRIAELATAALVLKATGSQEADKYNRLWLVALEAQKSANRSLHKLSPVGGWRAQESTCQLWGHQATMWYCEETQEYKGCFMTGPTVDTAYCHDTKDELRRLMRNDMADKLERELDEARTKLIDKVAAKGEATFHAKRKVVLEAALGLSRYDGYALSPGLAEGLYVLRPA